MADPLNAQRQRLLTTIEGITMAPTSVVALELYSKAVADLGAEYIAVHFLPRPQEQRFESVCMAWEAPVEWRSLYLHENFWLRDPAHRQCRRSVLPFDWASAQYDPETEPQMKEVLDRGRDIKVDKGISVPIPGPGGMRGCVWAGGPHFEDRRVHLPELHCLALHVFHRLDHLTASNVSNVGLTAREREVLAWVSEGKTAWEIGSILNLSQRTVEWHVRQACSKLGATNRLQAIAILGNRTFDPIV